MKKVITVILLQACMVLIYAQKPVLISPFSYTGKQNCYKMEDTTNLYETLKLCPDRSFSINKPTSTVQISLPSSGGQYDIYDIYETHILKPILAGKYPYIRTYFAQCVTDKNKLAYLTFSPTICQITFINNDGSSSLKKDFTTQEFRAVTFTKESSRYFICGNNDNQPDNRLASTLATTHVQNCNAYLITSAFSCSKRFSQAAADEIVVGTTPTVAISLAKITSIINNEINPVYEREAAISFDLVSDADEVICINSDPFIENDIVTSTFINHGFIQLRIDDPEYKMGFLLDKEMPGASGTLTVGYATGEICGTEIGWNGGYYYGDNNEFHLETILHEIGHFFGAMHTFNFVGCTSENSEASVEPFGGYSIMGYGINNNNCWGGAFNEARTGIYIPGVWPNADINFDLTFMHFNVISLKQIFNSLANTNCLTGIPLPCSSLDAIANTPSEIVIPRGTSFMLRGNNSPNDNQMYYQFDQVDNGIIDNSAFPPDLYKDDIPLTPSYRSSNMPLRFFRGPLHGDSNQLTSSVGRDMNFNYLKRKLFGGVGINDINYKKVIVREDAGPLKFTNINNQTDLQGNIVTNFKFNENCTILWEVNNTYSLLENARVLDLYMIREERLKGLFPIRHELDSSDFILVAKDLINAGYFNGSIFFNKKITTGLYHFVLMTKDKTIFTFSHAKIEVVSQLIYPVGGEILMQGDLSNKAYFISEYSSNIHTTILLDAGFGYSPLYSELNALDSISIPTNQSHVSNYCKIQLEFRDGFSGPILKTMESDDFFRIIDTIPALSIAINNFTTLDNLDGSHLIPFINA